MNKQEFLFQLGQHLSGLSNGEREEQLNFYREMIDDRMEDGLSEEEAVAAIGSIDTITKHIADEVSPSEAVPKKRWKVWEITLLILGSPVWLSLLIAALAVVFSLYASLWAVIISAWAVFVSAAICCFALTVAGIILLFGEHPLSGVAVIGAGLVCAGVAILLFLGCKKVTSITILLTKKAVLLVKRCFRKKKVT